MKILAFETSCDETSAAVVDGRRILSNILISQVDWHAKYGGVVPDLAREKHKEFLPKVEKQALTQAGITTGDIEAIAVTVGPGLAIALEVGINRAKQLARQLKVPLMPINHMEGHLLAPFGVDPNSKDHVREPDDFLPCLGLLISGGHTEIILVEAIGRYQILGQTLDDAVGEAFDKVGRMLGLWYPCGPAIEKLAQGGRPRFNLPVPLKHSRDLNFSFSGLKTAVLYLIRDYLCRQGQECSLKDVILGRVDLDHRFQADLAASFQLVVIESLVTKLELAFKQNPQTKALILGGGVAHNQAIRKAVAQVVERYNKPLLLPYSDKLYSDNAGMIGVAASLAFENHRPVTDPDKLDRLPSLRLDEIAELY